MQLVPFFKNKRLLITGHTGFKGSWLAQILLNFGAKVCGYSLEPDTNPNLFHVLNLKSELEHHIADVRNFNFFNQVVKKFKPDIVFHLAAQPLVRDSYDKPRYTYEVNLMGTVNILESIRLNNVKAGVIITTDKVYKNSKKNVGYKEDDPLGGYDPYSNSKACADLAVNSYIQSFFNPKDFGLKHKTLVASTRAGNIIGGGDWAKDRLVPDLIRAFFVDKKALIIRNPQQIRPWQHVLEPLAGYLLLAKYLYEGDVAKVGAWNFGPEEKDIENVETVVKLCFKFLGGGKYEIQPDETKHESEILKLAIIKAKKELRWQPKFNLKRAVEETMGWYKEFHKNRSDIKKFTINQINKYFD